jgi:hypothetical protein
METPDIYEEALMLRVRQENGCEGAPMCADYCPCKRAVAEAFAEGNDTAQAQGESEREND